MKTSQVRSIICITVIISGSFYGITHGHQQSDRVSTFLFLLVIAACLVWYQNFQKYVPDTLPGKFGFFFGRLAFVGIVVYINFLLITDFRERQLSRDGVNTYAVAGRISSGYYKGRYHFSRHYRYMANGKVFEKQLPFSYKLKAGDTLYLKYSASDPEIMQFVPNSHNRQLGIMD
jgi:hypothetical protein